MTGTALRVLALQCLATAVLAAAMLPWGAEAAVSALLGGAVGFAGTLVYVLAARNRATGARRTLMAHVFAEAAKVATVILLLGAVLGSYPELAALPFFAAFIASLMAYWMALIFA